MQQSDQEVDVLVIGAGPVGLALALALGQEGLSVRVAEAAATINESPRAVHLDGEALRLLQALGVADEFAPLTVPVHRMHFVDEDRTLLFEIDWGTGQGPQAWPNGNLIHQPDLEALFAAAIGRMDHVELSMSTSLESLEQDDTGVTATLTTRNGETRTTRARYLVGCDGSRSTVRPLIGSEWSVMGPAQQWLVVDGRVADGDASDLPDYPEQRPWPRRPQFFMRGAGGRVRWEFRVMPDDDTSSITAPRSIESLVKDDLDPTSVEIERAAVYVFRSHLASKWQSGRVFIAGDAAHLQPPFLAQGLCSGLRDIGNLSWKLAHAIRTSDHAVLEDYESERQPHAAAWVTEATRVAELCQELDEKKASARNAFLLERGKDLAPLVPSLGPGLHGTQGRPAGSLAPQPRLADGRRMDDAVGRNFVCLTARAVPSDLVRAFDPICELSGAEHPEVARLLQDWVTTYAVIRPDRYVLGAANNEAELASLLSRVPRATRGAVIPPDFAPPSAGPEVTRKVRKRSMRPRHHHLLVPAVLVAVVAMLAAACSSGSDTTSQGSDPAQRQEGSAMDALYAGTYSDPPAEAPEHEDGKTVWMLSCGQVAPACAATAASGEEAAKSLGWETRVCDGKLNPATWSQCIRQAQAAGADALVSIGIDCAAIQQPLQEAKDAGMAVINAEGVDCDDPSVGGEALFAASVVANDESPTINEYNEALGRARAEWIKADSDGNANIVEVNFEGATIGISNHTGFTDGIKDCTGCTVNEAVVTNESIGNLRQIVESALLKNPDATYVVVPLDSLTLLGTSQAVMASAQRAKLTVIGGEGTAAAMDLLRNKQGLNVIVGQSPEWWGWASMDTVLRVFAREPGVPQGIGYQVMDGSSELPASGGYVPPIDYKSAYKAAWGV